MRVVTWTMNQAGHANSHHEAWAFLRALDPDIALLQEVIAPEGVSEGYQALWTRAWDDRPWGSAGLSRVGDLLPVWRSRSEGAVVMETCSIPSLGTVSIASIHARIVERRVIRALRRTFEALRTRLGSCSSSGAT